LSAQQDVYKTGGLAIPTNPAPTKQILFAAEIGDASRASSTGDTLPSSSNNLAFNSGEPTPELGGEVFGEPRSQSFADHEFGVEAPGLIVDAMEWELGKDRPSWPRIDGPTDPEFCE
jgi:hypothetical protein